MKKVTAPWIRDIANQLAIATILRNSPVGAAQRLSLIVVDNAVEYALKTYVVQKRLVGTKPSQISPTKWEEKKRNFNKLIRFVQSKSGLDPDMVQSIIYYHEIRNSLYHGATPQTAYLKDFQNYLKLAKELVSKLFGYGMTETQWSQHIKAVRLQVLQKESPATPTTLRRQVKIEAKEMTVTFETKAKLSASEMILIIVYAYLRKLKKKPTTQHISDSLEFSGFHIDRKVLRTRLSELVRQHKLTKKNQHYSLRPSGAELLKEKFHLTFI